LCTKAGYHVIGGFSKLLNHVKAVLNPQEIISWCDLRYATGVGYNSVGFEAKNDDFVSWQWTDYHTTYNRLRCRANMDERGLTEAEHAEELGWVKIYDAGQRFYILDCKR
jgi:hypothetical protein